MFSKLQVSYAKVITRLLGNSCPCQYNQVNYAHTKEIITCLTINYYMVNLYSMPAMLYNIVIEFQPLQVVSLAIGYHHANIYATPRYAGKKSYKYLKQTFLPKVCYSHEGEICWESSKELSENYLFQEMHYRHYFILCEQHSHRIGWKIINFPHHHQVHVNYYWCN